MDMFDDDLREIMGDRYDDGDAPIEMPAIETKKPAPEAEKPAPKKSAADDAQYVPYPNERHGAMDRLRVIATWLGICGGISMLLWWFWMNDLMAMEAAYPCILASAVIGGIGVGRSSK